MLEIKLFLAYSEKEDFFIYLFVISGYIIYFITTYFTNVKKFLRSVDQS